MSRKVEVRVDQIGPSTSRGTAGTHTILIDRPEAKGGADRGPMGGQVMLIGLGGCFMSNLLAAIRAREAAISDVHLNVVGTIEENPDRITSIAMTVSANYADADLMQKIVTIADRGCIASNTLKQGVPISITFEKSGASVGT